MITQIELISLQGLCPNLHCLPMWSLEPLEDKPRAGIRPHGACCSLLGRYLADSRQSQELWVIFSYSRGFNMTFLKMYFLSRSKKQSQP